MLFKLISGYHMSNMCLSRDEYIAKTDMNDGCIRYTSLPTSRGKTRGIRKPSVKLL
jgi:hypothetical protein